MTRPLMALSILLVSLCCVVAISSIGHCQPGCPRDSMRCGEELQCPYRGTGLPLVPRESGSLETPDLQPVADVPDATTEPAKPTPTIAPVVGEPVVPTDEVRALETVPSETTPSEQATETNPNDDASPLNADESEPIENVSELDNLYKHELDGYALVPHIRITPSTKRSFTNLKKRLHGVTRTELGVQLAARCWLARDQVAQWGRTYQLDQLATRWGTATVDDASSPAENPLELTTIKRHCVLAVARQLNQFGTLIQGASRQLEQFAHEPPVRQADRRAENQGVR